MALAVRFAVVVFLVAGPLTDEATDLAGWDAERFQEIADRRAPAWAEVPVEYPPGSVIVFDVVAGPDVVATHRTLVVASFLLELAAVALLWRSVDPSAAKAFLLLGLPLVPMGLQRLDMLVTVVAVAAAVALIGPRRGRRPTASDGWFAGLVAIGVMVKLWPGLLVAGALALGRRSAAMAAAVTTVAVGLVWLAAVGAGLDPIDQVLSLRGATGWHVESLPGTVVALLTGAEQRFELNAYRIGTIDRGLVTAGRVLAVGLVAALVVSARTIPAGARPATVRLGLVMLGSTAALLATAPLLSPQFLLWLTPWGALLVAGGGATPKARWTSDGQIAVVLGLLVLAVGLTGGTLTVFGPDDLTGPVPAFALAVRNLVLVALPVACFAALRAGPEGELTPPGQRTGTPVGGRAPRPTPGTS